MIAGQDPVGNGFVQSLARPGGNVTGLDSIAGQGLRAKRLSMLKEIDPTLSRVAVLREVGASSERLSTELREAAHALGLVLEIVAFRNADGLEDALATIAEQRGRALVIDGGPLVQANMNRIAAFAIQHRMLATYSGRQYAADGLLFTYGLAIPDNYRRAAFFVDRILKGARPSELPVEQPLRFELILNQKTAKAIGVSFPRSFVARADEIIE